MERSQIEETLALLQAQCAVHHLVIKTLIRRDPDSLALLATWRDIRRDAAVAKSLLPPDSRHSHWLAEQIESFAEEWTAELADLAIEASPPTQHSLPVGHSEKPGARPRRRAPQRQRAARETKGRQP